MLVKIITGTSSEFLLACATYNFRACIIKISTPKVDLNLFLFSFCLYSKQKFGRFNPMAPKPIRLKHEILTLSLADVLGLCWHDYK